MFSPTFTNDEYVFLERTLNEHQLDYLNYMLGSITSSSSMNHTHTRAHTTAESHTLCLPAVS